MIRIAILEDEHTAKAIIYELGKLLHQEEWLFRPFLKASELAAAQQGEEYDIVILKAMFATQRAESVFVRPYEDRVVIYVLHEGDEIEAQNSERTFFLHEKRIIQELREQYPKVDRRLRGKEEYVFSYNNVKVILSMNDIYYLSKEDKLVCFHTRRGLFSERASMNDMAERFAPYGFERIHASFLVNMHHVFGVESDTVLMDQQDRLPLARSRKQQFLGIMERKRLQC